VKQICQRRNNWLDRTVEGAGRRKPPYFIYRKATAANIIYTPFEKTSALDEKYYRLSRSANGYVMIRAYSHWLIFGNEQAKSSPS
jgi:hypothetical protein